MPHRVDSETVRHVAKLARIRIEDDEVAVLAQQLSKILEYVAVLSEVETAGVDPAIHAEAPPDALRDDSPAPTWSARMALDNAPDAWDGFVRVPKVLEQESA